MNLRRTKESGITLIALVITIIILIILAGVSINILLGENGIITKAKEAKEIAKLGEIIEELELLKGPVAMNNLGRVEMQKYLEYAYGNFKHNITNTKIIDEKYAYITVDSKYLFLLEQEDNWNLLIIYKGEPKDPTAIQGGEYVSYQHRTGQSFTITRDQTGHSEDQTFNTSDYTGSWKILYNDDIHGLQIISTDIVGELTLKGKIGYNKLVPTLNTISSYYRNTEYDGSARSIGSSATGETDTTAYYTNSNYSFIASHASDMLAGDEFAANDYAQLAQLGMTKLDNKYYWMASRYVLINENGAGFHAGFIGENPNKEKTSDNLNYALTCAHANGNVCESDFTAGVRVVIKLENVNILTGDGTKDNPYIISKK